MEIQNVQPREGAAAFQLALVSNERTGISPRLAQRGMKEPLELPADSPESENLRMQLLWNRTMREEMQLPEGYQNIAVLILKWTKELDQLESGPEVC